MQDFMKKNGSLLLDNIANKTSVSNFLLMEFSKMRELQILHLVAFLILYLAIMTGNLLIVFAVIFDHRLHTPMYFFLMNLAILDLGSISVTMPKSMVNSFFNTRLISYSGRVAQVFFLVFFVASDFALLTVMAHDRYVVICNPLRYETIMNKGACIQMVVSAWISGLLYGAIHTGSTFAITFCSNVVDQFFCEIPQMLKLSCSNLYLVEGGVLLLSGCVLLGCFIFIIVTYVHIFTTVLRMPSRQGRQKAFSACLPHLIVVSMFVFTGCFAYLRSSSKSPSAIDLIFSFIYSIVPPMMNPLIYSMRNKEIKIALWKLLDLKHSAKNDFSRFLQ